MSDDRMEGDIGFLRKDTKDQTCNFLLTTSGVSRQPFKINKLAQFLQVHGFISVGKLLDESRQLEGAHYLIK